jgi:hypothetical protein
MATRKKAAPKPLPVNTTSGPTSAGWHEIEAYMRCPKEYQFKQVRKIRKPQAQTPDYFAVGQLFHVAKAHWFARQFDSSEATLTEIRNLLMDAAAQNKLPVAMSAIQTTLRYFEEYVAHYRMAPRPRVLAAEYDVGPAALIPGDDSMLWRTARLDDVSYYPEAGNKLCIGETKTTSGTISDCVMQYTLHGQPILQRLLWKVAPQGEAMHGPVVGVMLDVIQKGYSGKPCKFQRVFIPISDYTLEWYAKSLRAVVQASKTVTWDSDELRNVSMCSRLIGRARLPCEYRELCMYGRSASINYVLEDGSSLLTSKKGEAWK